ncbi:hypothetical protein WJX73_003127 [Symbiochloris irregularis]|uniref:AB hydrolase-1 domain-containing protein n=1 Tax=Symbiochloris irregularis TaxID=706552 RepID=A0AAW1PIX9_9CHLO
MSQPFCLPARTSLPFQVFVPARSATINKRKQASRNAQRVRAESLTADTSGRPDSSTAQVALEPGSTAMVDLNAATVNGADGNRVTLADILRDDGAPPRFVAPYVPGDRRSLAVSELPLLFYLPGIDGTGLAASRQFPGLAREFDLRALSIPGHDRTPFQDLVKLVITYMEGEVLQEPPTRPVYLLGESFGGILSLAVAHERPDLVDRVVLVNPATSFPRSIWPTLGPLLPQVPQELYKSVPVLLAPVLGNPLTLAAFGIDPKASTRDKIVGFLQGLQRLIPQLQALADILPAPTLAWKLKLLEEGSRVVEPLLKGVKQRVLILVSDGDFLLPSRDEGPRLKKLLPRANLKVFNGRGHALLQEAGIALEDILKEQGFYVRKREMSAPVKKRQRQTFGDASPIELPTERELAISADGATQWLRRLVSPVTFSTDAEGRVHQGLAHLPTSGRPVLYVGNHQTMALDIGFLIEDVLRERGVLMRGLAHPAVFGGMSAADTDGNSDFSNFMSTFGAVPVGGRNFFKLLQNNESVVLFPGGVREAYKRRGEKYKVFWPVREEFVRMAARFNAVIVPFGGVGCEDGFEIVRDSKELLNTPFVGKWLEGRVSGTIPAARRGVSENKELEELFVAPLVAPSIPSRFYTLFGRPIETNRNDTREQSQRNYAQAKQDVEGCISYLLNNRERDPYKDFFSRVAYEASWGGKAAPTFKP